MLLLVDNGSIFTKNLVEFLSSKNVDFRAVEFDKISEGDFARYSSFILSGRRKNNQQMNAVNSKLINHAISARKPLLGICYGAEILALTVGGTIRQMSQIQKGERQVTTIKDNPLCSGTVTVYQSHSFEISRPGSLLAHLGSSQECKYEIVQYQGSKIFGTQFHPEMTTDGLAMIERFVSL